MDSLTTDTHEALETQSPLSPLHFLRLAWRQRSLLMLGIVVGIVVGAVYYSRLTPIYQSSAQVLVVQKTLERLPGANSESNSASTEDYLSTHQTLIRSPAIVNDALQQANLKQLPSFINCDDVLNNIIKALKVSREKNDGKPTSILNISFRGPNAEDTSTVITAIVESYQSFLNKRYKNVASDTVKLITEANDILEKKLIAKQKEYDDFIAQQPAFRKGKDGIGIVQERLWNLESKRSALLVREVETQGQIAALEKTLKEGRHSRAELLAMIAQMPQRAGGEGITPAMTLEERAMTLELQEKSLSEDYGPDHPEVRSVRNQLALLQMRMKRLDENSTNAESAQANPMKVRLQMLKLELENARMTSKTLDKMLQEEYGKAKPLRGIQKKDEAYRTEIAHQRQLFEAVSKRLDEISILKDFAGGYEAETIFPPSAGKKVYPRLLTVLAPALLVGLLLGFGLAYLADLSDQSFRTPEEVRRQLGLPVVGYIPFFETDAEEDLIAAEKCRLAPSLRTVYHPRSHEAEAYRAVRTALYFSSRENGHAVIQVTSADMGDGKTTLISNLAVSIAQSNKKVIVLDADLRRARLHKLFDLSPQYGLTSLLSGEAEINDVVQSTSIPGLFVLPCGPIPPNPAELLTFPRFKELLGYFRTQYDFVLIDTPPLLAATDPCVVVPHVDGVILTVRITKKARPHAARAKEILATLKARVLGVVVNGAGPEAKNYGYYDYRYHYDSPHDGNNQDDLPSVEVKRKDSSPGNEIPGAAANPNGSRRSPRKKARWTAWLFAR